LKIVVLGLNSTAVVGLLNCIGELGFFMRSRGSLPSKLM